MNSPSLKGPEGIQGAAARLPELHVSGPTRMRLAQVRIRELLWLRRPDCSVASAGDKDVDRL